MQYRTTESPLKSAVAAGGTVLSAIAVFFASAAIFPADQHKTVTFSAPFDVDPNSAAAVALASASADDDERRLLERVATRPVATWITSDTRLVESDVERAVTGAASRDSLATLVAYGIPDRDCGGYSSAGARADAADYREWIDAFVAGLGRHRAIVIVEPDAVAQVDCLDDRAADERLDLLREAVRLIAAQGSWVYLDAGHSGWIDAEVMAERLQRAGVEDAAGFSLNVSNFRPTESEIAYGTEISDALGGDVHFVIDTSRNGVAARDREWCNPPHRGLGRAPTQDTGDPLVDAYLWIKTPGRSDGECNGGPAAGQWWQEYALELARNAVSG